MKENDTMLTIKEIQQIIKDFEKSELTQLELELDGVKIKLSKNKTTEITTVTENNKPQTYINKPEAKAESKEKVSGQEVKSPLVGTFYRSESPASPPFVEVGTIVKKGDVLCIIEAMKIMNEITAPHSGKITKILLEDKDVVSFDQVLMIIGQGDEA